jgi:hypothetical protein
VYSLEDQYLGVGKSSYLGQVIVSGGGGAGLPIEGWRTARAFRGLQKTTFFLNNFAEVLFYTVYSSTDILLKAYLLNISHVHPTDAEVYGSSLILLATI